MKTLKPLLGSCLLGLCSLAFAATAQTTAPATPSAPAATSPSTSSMPMTKEDAKTHHEAEMKKCDAMSGAAKDTCMAQAKSNYEKNKTDAMKEKAPAAAPMENQKKY